jgi:copper chaperone NosL
MKQIPRMLMALAAAALLMLFVFPMWQIILYAPQYPDGVKMYIHIDKIGGETPSTIQNINILNHYVGMKAIEPDDIPELKYFPYIIIAMAALGFLAAIVNRKGLFLGWAILMILLAIAGLYDFYLWEYDYGHNLDPKAPMSFEGESFQPPLIGRKTIINFVAVSLPHIGGYFAGSSILLAIGAWYLKRKNDRS